MRSPSGRTDGLVAWKRSIRTRDDLFGGVALELRHAPLLGQHPRLPGRHAAERSQAHEEHRRRARPPAGCAPRTCGRGRASVSGWASTASTLEEPADLFAELARGNVPALGLLPERHQDDVVEVSANARARRRRSRTAPDSDFAPFVPALL